MLTLSVTCYQPGDKQVCMFSFRYVICLHLELLLEDILTLIWCHCLFIWYWGTSPTANELNMLDVRWPEWMKHHRCSVPSLLMVITNKENKRCTWYSWRFIVLILIVSYDLQCWETRNKRTLKVVAAVLTPIFFFSVNVTWNSNPTGDVLNSSSV